MNSKKGMVTIQFIYHEINDQDYTGIVINVLDSERNIVAVYRNFDPSKIEAPENTAPVNWENIWENQTEEFQVGSMEMAKELIESSQSYTEVERVA